MVIKLFKPDLIDFFAVGCAVENVDKAVDM